ncbi:hypothetical protein K3G63_04820 [Hymenobacter sp. HSC-4F20]|uniref:hypothetical protein n=1 Tax=Hymenobacter sp. HSC-4F20 TaxID=2864135 RepID=UPI001C7343B9|nr:hypothetical protein [Hymenobacter sp. HSC-4F20]MBX0289747.1 hypothetical protein [Hymenobacter sp. HSC-4F20]
MNNPAKYTKHEIINFALYFGIIINIVIITYFSTAVRQQQNNIKSGLSIALNKSDNLAGNLREFNEDLDRINKRKDTCIIERKDTLFKEKIIYRRPPIGTEQNGTNSLTVPASGRNDSINYLIKYIHYIDSLNSKQKEDMISVTSKLNTVNDINGQLNNRIKKLLLDSLERRSTKRRSGIFSFGAQK